VNILNLHNAHAFPGGMEVLFAALSKLLRERGHTVTDVSKHNSELSSTYKKLAAFAGAIHSPTVYKEITKLIKDTASDDGVPTVAHVHNLYPQFSTSALDAFYDNDIPVLIHVQDYKLTCPAAQHRRDGKTCEKCVTGSQLNCAVHNCRGSRAMSTAYALRNAWARGSGRIERSVSMYLCPTQFVADLTIRGGYPADRVRVIPNFCDLPDVPPRESAGEYIGYVGRISPEKGLDVLVDAARRNGLATKIAGDPHLMPELLKNVPANVEFVGQLDRAGIARFLDGMKALVVPSTWYEAFGIVCVEALSRGIPVIASDIGGLPEVVWHNETGLLVPPGDSVALAEAMQQLWDDPALARKLGHRGYAVARERFTVSAFYQNLTSIWAELSAAPLIQNSLPRPLASANI